MTAACFKRLLLMASLLATLNMLAACAPHIAEPGPAVAPQHIEADTFVAADGAVLTLRVWLPEEAPRAVVIALHGFNDYSKAFTKVPDAPGVGPFLADRGFAVYAYDQRGFGHAPHFGLWPGGKALTADFTAFATLLRERYPNTPLYGLGVSMGGAVIMTALAGEDPPPLDGAVLAAPAVWSRSTMPWYYRAALWVARRVMPGLKPSGKGLGRQASDNMAMLKDNARDPLFIKRTRIDAVAGLTDLMDAAFRAADHQSLPILYLYGRKDEIIPPTATAIAMERMLSADARARGVFYDNAWHMMLRDKQAETVLHDVAAFLESPTATLPSGADRAALVRLKDRGQKPWIEKRH